MAQSIFISTSFGTQITCDKDFKQTEIAVGKKERNFYIFFNISVHILLAKSTNTLIFLDSSRYPTPTPDNEDDSAFDPDV